jgi:hypothetical protein
MIDDPLDLRCSSGSEILALRDMERHSSSPCAVAVYLCLARRGAS